MAFVDECTVLVHAGKGGDGSASLHSEPFKPRGGPDGGDGGDGGSVVAEVDGNVHDLAWLADHPHQRAGHGAAGRSSKRDGASGKDLVLRVPDGTVVFDEEGLIADLVGVGARAVLARGGRGGRGNAKLATARNRLPRVAEPGEHGEERRLRFELRTVADVGLVGLPNAGKSTLLSRLTAAKPKIGDYPFTTLTPNLGVAGGDVDRYVVADVPGLIEGASEGRGLGHRFLRHVVRCPALVLVVDLSTDDPAADLRVLREELAAYDAELARRPSIVVGTKADLVDDAPARAARLDADAIAVSSTTGEGLDVLADRLAELARDAAALADERRAHVVLRPGRPRFTVDRDTAGRWRVRGRDVERWVMEADLDDERSLAKLQTRLRKSGVDRRLTALGAQPGDEVSIRGRTFEYVPDDGLPDGPSSAETDGGDG
ncbi:MAG TPA: GTPase ObgE [Actinomycetota bacterium]|nr:GTPase ObgE [Actinomycetota bacterium]